MLWHKGQGQGAQSRCTAAMEAGMSNGEVVSSAVNRAVHRHMLNLTHLNAKVACRAPYLLLHAGDPDEMALDSDHHAPCTMHHLPVYKHGSLKSLSLYYIYVYIHDLVLMFMI